MIDIFNAIISGMGNGIGGLVSILPPSPFNWVYNIDNKYIQFMNFLFPFAQAVAHLTTYLSAVVIYYGIRIALKWVKAAGN